MMVSTTSFFDDLMPDFEPPLFGASLPLFLPEPFGSISGRAGIFLFVQAPPQGL